MYTITNEEGDEFDTQYATLEEAVSAATAAAYNIEPDGIVRVEEDEEAGETLVTLYDEEDEYIEIYTIVNI
jgi:hypothetical protein